MAQVKQMEERGSAPLRNYLAACHAFDMELSDLVSTAWTLPERASRLEPRYVALLRALEQVPTLSAAGLLLGWQQPTVAGRLSELYRLLDVAHLPVGERRLAVLRVARERGFLPPTIQTS